MINPLLEVRGLIKHFPADPRHGQWAEIRADSSDEGRKRIRALDGVSFTLQKGECLGVVGESGCGKTTLARCLLGLIEPDAGLMLFQGVNLQKVRSRHRRRLGRAIQAVFQDPAGSLNPRMTAGAIVEEPLIIQRAGNRRERRGRVDALLEMMELDPSVRERHPSEFSGGQRQRLAIARALAPEPDLLIADEPVAALDPSTQVQILNLLDRLQNRLGLSLLLIAHDLAIVRRLCHRVAVMRDGVFVEIGPRDQIFTTPGHPYTRELLNASYGS